MRLLAASARISVYREVDAVISLDVPGIDTLAIEIFEFDMHSYSPLWSKLPRTREQKTSND